MNRYLIPVLLVLLSVVIYQFSIVPLMADLQVLKQKQSKLDAALAEADDANAKIEKIAADYDALPSDAEKKLAQIIPEKNSATRLLIETTAFLERNGFSAKNLTVSADDTNEFSGPYREHRISFSIPASYETFIQFLHILESSMALRDIKSISFSTTAAGSDAVDTGIYEYSFTIVGYSLH